MHVLVVTDALRVKMRIYDSWPQGQDPNIRFAQLVSQPIGKGFLQRLIRMIHRLTRKRRSLERRDRSHIENGALASPWHHGVIQDCVRHEHVAIDIGVVHGNNIRDLKIWEAGRSSKCKTGLCLVLAISAIISVLHRIATNIVD